MSLDDKDLWKQIGEQVQLLPTDQRHDWQLILATLKERDQLTIQALKIAESGLELMNSKLNGPNPDARTMQKKCVQLNSDSVWRVDPQPGSGGCMWLV